MTEHVFCNWTASTKAALAAELAQAMLAYAGPIEVVDGFESTQSPTPARSDRIDPETVLKRKVVHVKPMHEGGYLDRYHAKMRNREVAAQVWA